MESGLSTKKWGPSAWVFMHSIAQRYPHKPSDIEKQHAKDFYTSLDTLLPCKTCKISYKKFIQILPIDHFLSSRKDLILWIYTIHNFVNYKLIKQGKDIEIPTIKEIYRKYENFSA